MDEIFAPKISIITIVRNDVAHIEKTILSVLNQTYKNVEYIIIDGGSTDGTLEIIKKYEKDIAVLVSEPDDGLYYALNKAVSFVTGDWVEILTSGDYLYNHTVLADIFAGKKIDADGVYGSAVGYVNGRMARIEAHEDVNKEAWKGMKLIFETLFVKAEIIKKYKFDTRYKVSGDGDFVLKCIASGYKFIKINVVVFETGAQGYSAKHWLIARKENWLISRKYFPGLKTDLYNLQGLVYFVVFRFFKNVLSAIGVYDFLKKYYRRWFGNKRMREKYHYIVVDDNNKHL
ncbi:MAG: glycosyltransferase family 2 protein [Patescibacteria group bacterium]